MKHDEKLKTTNWKVPFNILAKIGRRGKNEHSKFSLKIVLRPPPDPLQTLKIVPQALKMGSEGRKWGSEGQNRPSDPRNRPSDPQNGVWGSKMRVWGSKIRPKSHSRPSKMVRRTKNRCKIVKMTFEFSSIVILLFCCFGVWCLKSQNWNLIPFLNLEPSNRLFKWP